MGDHTRLTDAALIRASSQDSYVFRELYDRHASTSTSGPAVRGWPRRTRSTW